MSIVDILILSFIAMLSGGIGAYVILKMGLKKAQNELPDMILDTIDQIMPELPKFMAKDEVRQFIYSIGVLVGNGAKAGALGNTGKGKFKFEDLLGGLVQQFAPAIIQKVIPNIGSGEQQTQQQGVNDQW